MNLSSLIKKLEQQVEALIPDAVSDCHASTYEGFLLVYIKFTRDTFAERAAIATHEAVIYRADQRKYIVDCYPDLLQQVEPLISAWQVEYDKFMVKQDLTT